MIGMRRRQENHGEGTSRMPQSPSAARDTAAVQRSIGTAAGRLVGRAAGRVLALRA
jgi:hypothetical protein